MMSLRRDVFLRPLLWRRRTLALSAATTSSSMIETSPLTNVGTVQRNVPLTGIRSNLLIRQREQQDNDRNSSPLPLSSLRRRLPSINDTTHPMSSNQRCFTTLCIAATTIAPSPYNGDGTQHQHRSLSFTTSSLRRRRVKYQQYQEAQQQQHQAPSSSSTIDEPFEYSGENLEEYRAKANLSPWTPIPDSVARKIFDRAAPTPDDVHVELGSGDGRVNFHAIEYGVQHSIGIDVDPDIVAKANDRLQRIHPQPNLQFVVENLMDRNSTAWTQHVPNATILTMYFAKDGLEKIRPFLEQALRGKRCKIFTCGYAMPGWESQIVETVLDMPIYFYDWGNADLHLLRPESWVDDLPPGMVPKEMDQYLRKNKSNKQSNFRPDPLPGYHPDDLKDYAWDDFGPSSEDQNVDTEKK